jgi:hypothetical protein
MRRIPCSVGKILLFRLPPGQAERFGQRHQEIPLPHAFAIQHGIDEGRLIEARILNRLPDGGQVATTSGCEDLVDEWKHVARRPKLDLITSYFYGFYKKGKFLILPNHLES